MLSIGLTACLGSRPSETGSPETGSTMAPTPTLATSPDAFFVAPDGDDAHPGTFEAPWATVNHAASVLTAGQTVYLRGGVYELPRQVLLAHSGREDAWITYRAYPGEEPVLDASAIDNDPPEQFSHDAGSFNIERKAYIRVIGLTVRNSHQAGFMVRDSQHIELLNNTADTTFGPGIGVWRTHGTDGRTEHIKVLGNTVTRANTWAMLPQGYVREGEPPHEAISIAGAHQFEVAYNHVHNCDKEGIDVKETSAHGRVHHNYIHHNARQGLYVDSWFGLLEDVEVDHNVVHNCRGAGLALSVEGGKAASNIRIHHNLIYDNSGTGILFGRWGGDGLRTGIRIYNNTVHRNGYGPASPPTQYHWITGGLYLFSANLADVEIRGNIFSNNQGFQIGYSDLYGGEHEGIAGILERKQIVITHNLIHAPREVTYPIRAGWPDNFADVYAFDGDDAVIGVPLFVAPAEGNFHLQRESPGSTTGAFPVGTDPDFWWRESFPPRFDDAH
jgi:hypothetical protein